MSQVQRPYRSVLYIPGSKERALDKARSLTADAIIFDLEDAVAPTEKNSARQTLLAALQQGGYGARARLVRVNGLDTEWGAADLEMAAEARPDAVLLPKVNRAADVQAARDLLAQHPGTDEIAIWAMMETSEGILNAAEICAHPNLQGIVMGTNDLAKELRCRNLPDRMPMWSALQTCLLAARAQGVVAVDGVYNAFKDEDGLRSEATQGRDMGFDGKTLIHPAQLEVANQVFAPSEDELELARAQIAAFEEAEAAGQGVAVLNGRIVENLHVETARTLIAQAEMIAQLQAQQS